MSSSPAASRGVPRVGPLPWLLAHFREPMGGWWQHLDRLQREGANVLVALTLLWSTSPVYGHITRPEARQVAEI
jgi:hypothetical protein